MASGSTDNDHEEWDGDDANFTWDAVDVNKQRFWKLDDKFKDDVHDFIPFPELVETSDVYVQLKKQDIAGNSLRDVKTKEPLEAVYVSQTLFKKLKKEPGSGDFDFGSGVPVRTREGSPIFAEAVRTSTRRGNPGQATEGLAWANLFDNGVKAQADFVSLRFVNPNIDVILRSTSDMVTSTELQTIIDANNGVTKQKVTVSAGIPVSAFILVFDLDLVFRHNLYCLRSN
jgi:hypothetical protein